MVIARMGEQFDILATNSLPGQVFISSPVVAENCLYLRSQEALFCIRTN